MTRTIDEMIQQEVLVCVSSLVYELTGGTDTLCSVYHDTHPDFAVELWTANVDEDARESFAEAMGWLWDNDEEEWRDEDGDYVELHDEDAHSYVGEVYEHWVVTSHFAFVLSAYGEKVVRDWHGLNVWCRTTTGQAISMDHVIKKIHHDYHVAKSVRLK